VAIAIILIAFFVLGGHTPDTKASAQKVLDYYRIHRNRQMGAAAILAIGAAVLLMFAGWLRGLLNRAPATGRLAAIAFGGGVIATAGFFVAAGMHTALADSGKYADSNAVAQALNILDDDNYFAWAFGIALLVFAAGWSFIRTRAFPLWFGILGVVFGVVTFTPIGFFALMGDALWIIVLSIWAAASPRPAVTTTV
jgi:hypothetical protein